MKIDVHYLFHYMNYLLSINKKGLKTYKQVILNVDSLPEVLRIDISIQRNKPKKIGFLYGKVQYSERDDQPYKVYINGKLIKFYSENSTYLNQVFIPGTYIISIPPLNEYHFDGDYRTANILEAFYKIC